MKSKTILLLTGVSLLSFNFLKKKPKTPPGTVFFKDNLYIDETEANNQQWLDYMYWYKNKFGSSSEQYLQTLPDTTVWLDSLRPFNKPFAKYYLKHKVYRDYPVVGISHEQALAYCNWRTDRVNEFIYIKKEKVDWEEFKTNRDNFDVPEYVKYRLPTKIEWEEFANVPLSKKGVKAQNKGLPTANLISAEEEKNIGPNVTVTAPTSAYYPNDLGIYNLKGNIAELVKEKGICKGGHWNMKVSDLEIDKDYSFDGPNATTGFRCVAEKLLEY
jgi:formylglycine-generating enzyme required for sulfatase activity